MKKSSSKSGIVGGALVPLLVLFAFGMSACGDKDARGGGGNGGTNGPQEDTGVSAEDAQTQDDDSGEPFLGCRLDDPELPPCICRDPGEHSGPYFTNITASTTLGELGVTGVRIGAVDFDGDGLADLTVRNHQQGVRDDFAPGGARQTWLLRNLGGFQFEDITLTSGFTATRDGDHGRTVHTVIWGDVNNNGHLDAFTGVAVNPDPESADNGDRSEVMLNQGDGTFVLGQNTDQELYHKRTPIFGASFTDFDRDGHLDLWTGYANGEYEPQQDRLFRGDGQGDLTDATQEMGLTTRGWTQILHIEGARAHRNTWGTTVCDVNGDGWPDLISSAYGRYFNALWLGGSEGFADASLISGFASDDDEDWTTNLNAMCYCKLNREAEDCADVPDPPGYFSCRSGQALRWTHEYDRMSFRLGGNTFTTACGDINNNGLMDLMNFEISHWDVGPNSDPTQLLLNDGREVPRFNRPGNQTTGLERIWDGIAWDAGDMTGAFLDFDNDGRQDILIASSDYPGTRAFLFRQLEDGTFEEVNPEFGIDLARAHGVAIADLDGNGALDMVLGHSTMRCSGDPDCMERGYVQIFRNEVGAQGNWLRVNLVGGEGSNRAAIGAQIRLIDGDTIQTREVGGGYGHFGIQHELTQHFGLGNACEVDRLEVRWPDAQGTTEIFEGIRGNYTITIRQGAASVEYH